MKRFSELDHWPIFDEPYIVDLGVKEPYVETIVSGATDGAARLRDETPGMAVERDEWNEDFTERRVLKIRVYALKP